MDLNVARLFVCLFLPRIDSCLTTIPREFISPRLLRIEVKTLEKSSCIPQYPCQPRPRPPPPSAAIVSLSPDSILGVGFDFSQQRSICDKLPFKGPLHYWWDQMCWLSLHTLISPFRPLLTTLLIVLIAQQRVSPYVPPTFNLWALVLSNSAVKCR